MWGTSQRWRNLPWRREPTTRPTSRSAGARIRLLLIYGSTIGGACWYLAVASRPAANVFTVLFYFLCAGLIAAGVSAAILLERLTNAGITIGIAAATAAMVKAAFDLESGGLLMGAALLIVGLALVTAMVALGRSVPEGIHVAIAACLFAGSVLAVPVAASMGLRLFEGSFVSFAADVRAGHIPTTEKFRVGPYTYDRLCDSGDSVLIWHSGDDFMRVSIVAVDRDGTVSRSSLGEGSGAFQCNDDRLEAD